MSKRKVILTIATTGGMAHKAQNPHLPTQPSEIANDVLRCYNAGASVVAIHAAGQTMARPAIQIFTAISTAVSVTSATS